MSETVHATAVLCGADGVLIRGASGAGKSTLAALLVGRGARLIGDDRIHLSACHGRLIATVPAVIAGKLELRNHGLSAVAHERSAVIRLVVDLVHADGLERMPEDHHLWADVLGLTLPRQPVADASEQAILLVRSAISTLGPRRDMGLRSTRVWGR